MKAKLYKFLLMLSCLLIQAPAAQACQKLVRLSGMRETGLKGFLLGNRDAAIICGTIALGAYVVKKLFPAPDQEAEQVVEQHDLSSPSSGRSAQQMSPKSPSSASSPSSTSTASFSPQSHGSSPLSAQSPGHTEVMQQQALHADTAAVVPQLSLQQAPAAVSHSPIALRESHEACLALRDALKDLIAQKDASLVARGDIITCLNNELGIINAELGKKNKQIRGLKKTIDELETQLIRQNAKLEERRERDYVRGSSVQDW